MGNRDRLLEAALHCLYGIGYARTTTRDIAGHAGVSLAAIGYHFGSKEALLDEALRQAIEKWGDELAQTVSRYLPSKDSDTPEQRFARTWDAVIESLDEHRPLWAVQYELIAHVARTPQLRVGMDEATRRARHELFTLFAGGDGDDQEFPKAGMLLQALLLGVVGLWFATPDDAPHGADVTAGLRELARNL